LNRNLLGRVKVDIPSLGILPHVQSGINGTPFQINPGNQTNIPSSWAGFIQAPHNSCNFDINDSQNQAG